MAVLFSKEWKIEDVSAVLFDKDGTFVDSDIYWGKLGEMRIKAIIKHFNLPFELFENLAQVIGLDAKTGRLICGGPLAALSRDEVICILTNELVKNNNIFTDTVEVAQIFQKVHDKFIQNMFDYTFILDGALELFERLKNANVKMAVVTSDTYEHTVKTLEYLNISHYFDCVVGCDTIKEPKSTGVPALFALDKLKIDNLNAIVIGDAPMDAQMAKNGSLKGSILVKSEQISDNSLKAYSNIIVNNLSEIMVKL